MKLALLALSGMAALATVASAGPTNFYSNDFETAHPNMTGFSGTVNLSNHYAFSQFLGRYSQSDLVSLTLAAPADGVFPGAGSHVQYTVTWDLYIIDSWDAGTSQFGNDHWMMSANGHQVFNETFDNWGNPQTARAPDVGPVQLAYGNTMPDSIYRNLTTTFEANLGQSLTLSFTSSPLQGVWDESWGLDNLRIDYEVVPTPGAASIGALASLVALRRRR